MNIQEIIDELRAIFEYIKEKDSPHGAGQIYDLIKRLEKQKIVDISRKDVFKCLNFGVSYLCHCPNCGIAKVSLESKYCQECGIKLRWVEQR